MAAKSIPDIIMKRNNPNNDYNNKKRRPTPENESSHQKKRKPSCFEEADNDEMYVSSTQFHRCDHEIMNEEVLPPMMTSEEEEEEEEKEDGPTLVTEPQTSLSSPSSVQLNENARLQSPPTIVIKPKQHLRGKDLNRLYQNYLHANMYEKLLPSDQIKRKAQPCSPPIIKPRQHLRSKDLNRLFQNQQCHKTNITENSLSSDEINGKSQSRSTPIIIKPNQDLNRLQERCHHRDNILENFFLPIGNDNDNNNSSSPSFPSPLQRTESCMGRDFYPIEEDVEKSDYSSSCGSF